MRTAATNWCASFCGAYASSPPCGDWVPPADPFQSLPRCPIFPRCCNESQSSVNLKFHKVLSTRGDTFSFFWFYLLIIIIIFIRFFACNFRHPKFPEFLYQTHELFSNLTFHIKETWVRFDAKSLKKTEISFYQHIFLTEKISLMLLFCVSLTKEWKNNAIILCDDGETNTHWAKIHWEHGKHSAQVRMFSMRHTHTNTTTAW